MAEQKSYVDNGKRGRMLTLAGLIGVGLFLLRGWGLIDINSNYDLLATSAGFFIFTYIGLLVAFKFKVTWRSMLVSISQSSIFVAGEVLFVMMFFFREFSRVSDFVFLSILLLIIVFVTYAIFLMTNIFNVASFKPIPLIQVASTASFIATVMMIYFISFALINLAIPMILMISLIFPIYIAIMANHFAQMSIRFRDSSIIIFSTAIVGLIAFLAVLFLGSRHELSAIVPASVVFGLIGLEMSFGKSEKKNVLLFQHILVVIAAFLVNILFNR
ncbi:hypothetical protein H6762_02505 [Candidatus Nomurabacteria bacterium]|uniref:Uncharacterized protein n=1 Tax=Candidatus Dojkabacteria bacterium TaxID=2099670 RepID=A0A955KX10_9BACT|nr:hypothetical protein [Candidatus Dojkabacteria bacterium]MCB9789832.1 hypothetical protein [Candidatus Nomurabacteria bacterium]